MSKHESPMIRRYVDECLSGHQVLAAEEWPVVGRSGTTMVRRVDAIGLLDSGRHGFIHWRAFPSIRDRDALVIQAKAKRLSLALLGQAIGSAWLARTRHGARSVRSVALCGAGDDLLQPVADKFDIEVVVLEGHGTGAFGWGNDNEMLQYWLADKPGHHALGYLLGAAPRRIKAQAICVIDHNPGDPVPPSLEGRRCWVVVTPDKPSRKGGDSFGMATFGTALGIRELAQAGGAHVERSVILTRGVDPVMSALAKAFDIEVEHCQLTTSAS